MANNEKTFYQRLTRLFRSGPAIRRKIKGHDYKNFYDSQVVQNNLGYYGAAAFKREASPFSTVGAYGILDRMSRYAEFSEMESMPEIATALNVYADEACASDENGNNFHVYSDNKQIQTVLEELFFDVVNIEFTGRRMIRNLVKNGDYVAYVEVVPEYGVINVEPLPINEIEREEGFDKDDPYAVRFKLLSRGGKYLENWQMLHFRIIGNDLFLPYGTSFLESARRPWRQLCHLSGTRVLTATGYQNIEDIQVGETVYTHLPEQKRTVKSRVKHLVDMGVQSVVTVETRHRKISVTPNHGLLVRTSDGTFCYKKAQELIQSTPSDGPTRYGKADQLVLPSIVEGSTEKRVKFESMAQHYAVKLNAPATLDRVGVMDKLRQVQGTGKTAKYLHSFLTGTKKLNWESYVSVKQTLNLTDGVTIYGVHSKKPSRLFQNESDFVVDSAFCKFFGFMLGDGWVNKNGIGFAFGIDETQNQAYVDYASSLFGDDYHISRTPGTKSAQINWSNTETAHLFRHLGFKTGFANKRMPRWIYDLDIKCRWALVRGLFDADGCDADNTITLANETLINQLRELCWTIGIPVGKTISIRPGDARRKTSFKLWIDLTKTPRAVVYENVLRVTENGTGQTWDLEVEHEEHNFLANGIVTHNTMMEDSMLVYRLVRSPERRVFYIDVSAIPPNDVGTYMQTIKESLKGSSVIEQLSGREDFRYNPASVEDDFFLPTRPNNQTKIENLPGGQNATAVEDVEYIQKKLFAALMVPKAYLTYDEAVSSKATLAQEDIRFSRTIANLQKIVIAELNKLAIIHLYALGFEGEDLIDFELKFSNPSTVAVQQKLALIASKLDIAGKAWELSKETGFYSMNYISREILQLRPDEINQIKYEARQDQAYLAELKKLAENPPFDRSADSNVDIFDKSNYKVPTSPFAPDPDEVRDLERTTEEDEMQLRRARMAEKEREATSTSPRATSPSSTPIKHNPTPSSRRKAFSGNRALSMPDFKSMLDTTKNRYSKDPYDMGSLGGSGVKKFVLERKIEQDLLQEGIPYGIPKELQSALKSMNTTLIKPTRAAKAILEQVEIVPPTVQQQPTQAPITESAGVSVEELILDMDGIRNNPTSGSKG